MIKVYLTDTEFLKDEDIYKKALANVSEFRREKSEKSLLSLAASVMIGEGLKAYGLLEKNMEYGILEHKKPVFLNRPDIFFNISHSGNFAAAAFSDKSVGIDIEDRKRRADTEHLAKRFFSEFERALIDRAKNSNEVFFKLWTRKESLLKSDGCGITVTLSEVDVTENEVVFNKNRYKFYDISNDNIIGTVCEQCH